LGKQRDVLIGSSEKHKGSIIYGEKTKTIRVPESAVTDIKSYLELRQQRVSLSLVPLAKMISPIAEVSRVEAVNDTVRIPLVGSRVAAGIPSPADDYMEDYLDLNQLLISEKESTYLVRVKGESMMNIGIFPKDLLIVDRSREPKDGDIVIAVLDGELTVKRLEKRGHRIALGIKTAFLLNLQFLNRLNRSLITKGLRHRI
jgi:DNA polymerase V